MAQWITRSEWRALPPKGSYSYLTSPQGTAIHWPGDGRWATKDPREATKQIQEIHFAHPTENYMDIAYNLTVASGVILEGRSTASNMNRRSGANGTTVGNTSHFAICVLHGSGDGEPSDLLLRTIGEAVALLRQHAGAGRSVMGHKDFRSTLCPGVFYKHLAEIRSYADSGGATKPEDDMFEAADRFLLQEIKSLLITGGTDATPGKLSIADLARGQYPVERMVDGQLKKIPAIQELADIKTFVLQLIGQVAGLKAAIESEGNDVVAIEKAVNDAVKEALGSLRIVSDNTET